VYDIDVHHFVHNCTSLWENACNALLQIARYQICSFGRVMF